MTFKTPTLSMIVLLLAGSAAAMGGAAADSASANAGDAARIEALRQSPDLAGARVYRGAVYAQGATNAVPLFTYERRVATTDAGLAAAHITRGPDQQIVVVEEARFTSAYALQRFDAINPQQGFSGSVVLSQGGRHLQYRLLRDGKLSTATEEVSDPVVAGPSLHGFVLQHWDTLASGLPLAVRMVVLTDKTSYGFQIRQLPPQGGLTNFSITPSSAFVRLVIAPLKVSFDSKTRALVRYEGRVPPMRQVGPKLVDLDARVDYVMDQATYR